MQAHLVRLLTPQRTTLQYLAWWPYGKTWGWFSGDMVHATPVSEADADRLAAMFRAIPDDVWQREGTTIDVITDPRNRPVFNDAALLQEQLVAGR